QPMGLVSQYAAEKAANDSVGANNGTLLGGATFAPGVLGQAFSLDGVDDSVDMGKVVLGTSGPFTVSAWINLAVTSGNQAIIEEIGTENAAGQFQFRVSSGGSLSFLRRTGLGNGVDLKVTNSIVPAGVWTHVAAVFSGGNNLAIYINGQQANGA